MGELVFRRKMVTGTELVGEVREGNTGTVWDGTVLSVLQRQAEMGGKLRTMVEGSRYW